jgi:hypothetical protein
MYCLIKRRPYTLIVAGILSFGAINVQAEDNNTGNFKFGGFVKVSTAFSTKGLNGIDDALGLYNADLLFAGENKGTRFGINAKESRLHVTYTKQDTTVGPIKAYIECNFGVDGNGDSNTLESYGISNARFVLRHAYVEVGNFLVGQTYSTFLDPISSPDIIDYGGNAASVFARQPQIRYTQEVNDLTFRLAVENPTSNLGTNLITDDQRMPDFVGRVDYDSSFGHLSIAGIIRELRIDTNEFEAHKITGGISVTFSKTIIPNRLYIMAQYIRGGIGHYGSFSAFSDGIILENEKGEKYIDPLDFHGATVSTTIHWMDQLRSTFVGSWTKNLDPGQNTQTLGTGHSIETVKSLHANLLYDITENFLIGIEYKKLIGELSDYSNPNVDRYQASIIYQF